MINLLRCALKRRHKTMMPMGISRKYIPYTISLSMETSITYINIFPLFQNEKIEKSIHTHIVTISVAKRYLCWYSPCVRCDLGSICWSLIIIIHLPLYVLRKGSLKSPHLQVSGKTDTSTGIQHVTCNIMNYITQKKL